MPSQEKKNKFFTVSIRRYSALKFLIRRKIQLWNFTDPILYFNIQEMCYFFLCVNKKSKLWNWIYNIWSGFDIIDLSYKMIMSKISTICIAISKRVGKSYKHENSKYKILFIKCFYFWKDWTCCVQGGSKVRGGSAFENFRESLYGHRSVTFEVMRTM